MPQTLWPGEELLNSAQAAAGGKEGSYQGHTAGQGQGRADTGSTSPSGASALPGTAVRTEPQAPSRDPLCPHQHPAAVHDQVSAGLYRGARKWRMGAFLVYQLLCLGWGANSPKKEYQSRENFIWSRRERILINPQRID